MFVKIKKANMPSRQKFVFFITTCCKGVNLFGVQSLHQSSSGCPANVSAALVTFLLKPGRHASNFLRAKKVKKKIKEQKK
jgi:hypothetical protein